jgi:hypothetical protein
MATRDPEQRARVATYGDRTRARRAFRYIEERMHGFG